MLEGLGVDPSVSVARYRIDEATEHLGWSSSAIRLYEHPSADWVYLFDASPQEGVVSRESVLVRLSSGCEVVAAWTLVHSTTRLAHVRDGQVVARCDAWSYEPASGIAPQRLNPVLEQVGFFPGERDEEEERPSSAALALEALEQSFGLAVDAEAVRGPLPTVVVPARAG